MAGTKFGAKLGVVENGSFRPFTAVGANNRLVNQHQSAKAR